MKKHYILIFLMSTLSFSQNATITKVIETPCTSPFVKTVEIVVTGTIDFANDDIQLRYSENGGGFDPSGDNSLPNLINISGLNVQTNTYVYLIRNLALMQAEFPGSNITAANSLVITISTNGNDAYQLTKADGTVISQFGEDNINGDGTAWDHLDTYAERKSGTTETGTFVVGDWDVFPINTLDGKGLCARAASQDPSGAPGPSAYENTITLGTWKTLSSNDFYKSELSIYPNPTNNGLVTIKSQLTSVKNITLFDMLGRSVLQTKLNSEVLDVRTIKSGLYLLQVSIGDRSSTSKLIIK
jgi:hypothetical protein